MEVLEGDITQLTAKMQINGTISMIVLAEMYLREVLVVQEPTFYSIKEEIDYAKNLSYNLFISFLFSNFWCEIVFEFTSAIL
jgi:hypothetical protein